MRGMILFLALVLTTTAQAAETHECSVESATNEIIAADIQRQARSAQASNALLEQLSNLTSKAKHPNRSVGDQLTPRDAARFAEISTKLLPIRFGQLLESAHKRDAVVVQTMFSDAWSSYGDSSYTPKQDDLAGALLVVMRTTFKDPSPPPALPSGPCTMDSALIQQQREAFQRVNIYDPIINRNVAILTQLKAKYDLKDGRLDITKMEPEDVRTFQRATVELQPAMQQHKLAADIENIHSWWQAAQIVYRDRKEDFETYGPDANSLDKTLNAQADKLDQKTRTMIALWFKLDERMPSEEAKMVKMMSNTVTKDRHQ